MSQSRHPCSGRRRTSPREDSTGHHEIKGSGSRKSLFDKTKVSVWTSSPRFHLMGLAPRHLRCWAAKRMVKRIPLDPSTFPTDWDIARTGLVNAFQQTFQCMPKGLGEVSIPNPYQKVKDKLTWSCKFFTNTFSIQSQ